MIVALISCAAGIGITYWLLDSRTVSLSHDTALPHSTESKVVYTKEAQPGKDYAVGEYGEKAATSEIPKKEKEDSGPLDYFKVSSQLSKFNLQMEEEAGKKYESVKLSDKINEPKDHYLVSKMNAFKTTKTHWFTATVPGNGANKIVFYVNYYPCSPSVKQVSSKDSCFMIKYFSFYNERWTQYALSSTVSYFSWSEDTPYVALSMEGLGAFAQENKMLKTFIPIPDEGGKMTFLKYDQGKFIWEDGGDIHWTPTNEKAATQFEKETQDYSISRGERLGQ